jgi:hypothetical protein
MALTILLRCSCQTLLHVYVQKQRVFPELLKGHEEAQQVDWREVDAEEEARGAIEVAKRLATMAGDEFVDSRETAHVLCPRCGEIMDVMEMLRNGIRRTQASLS